MKLALRPVAKNAPPRPRRFDASSSSTPPFGSSERARSSWRYPPTFRYPSRVVRSCSVAPPRTSSLRGIGRPPAQLGDDPGDVLGLDRLAVAVVDRDDRAPPATAGALDEAERDRAVLRR